MREIKLFMFDGCPYCRRAAELIETLFAEHPEYRRVPLTRIDEHLHPEIADQYDYYHVPTLFVGDEKVMEGAPSKAAIEAAFARAMTEQ